jgi:hypothetical protein
LRENRNKIPAGKIERGERKQTASEVLKSDWTMPKRGLTLPPRSAWEMPETAQAASGM